MFLQFDQSGVPMKRVYLLSEELKADPGRIALAQALTLNAAKPRMGLKGTLGLFGSPEWWANIEQRRMPLRFVQGIIRSTYFAGQDEPGDHNSFELLLEDGATYDESIYANDKASRALFRVGHRVEIVYALDESKRQPAQDGGVNYSDIVLEMAVSLEPVK
ncbi:hypothetical protein [Variovorax paradoxus]|uniref:hypothetical protein n=1 Tax=Variovorax paradoxus TaxID=34073 RepID=UPI002780930E|nr:hypothetical protein [Variovorax paradoxus]MDP9932633.1 hypothetical protein [Variovorax paradoxus]